MSGQDDLNCGLIPLNTNTFSLDNGSYFFFLCLNPENHQFDAGFHKSVPTHAPVEGLRYGGAGVYLVVLYCLRGVFCSILYIARRLNNNMHAKKRQDVHIDVWHKENASERISTTSRLCSLKTLFGPPADAWRLPREGVTFSVPNISQSARRSSGKMGTHLSGSL